MTDIIIIKNGSAGRITLNRPKAMNAMTYAMCTAIEAALEAWRSDPSVAVVIFDAAGERRFALAAT